MSNRVNIAPLSANRAWQGRRFRTPALKQYQRDLTLLLPSLRVPEGKIEAIYKFGLSSANSDLDNCIKATQDILATKYQFNDKMIFRLTAEKEKVKKGGEYVEFELREYI